MSDTPRTSELRSKHHRDSGMPIYKAYVQMADLAAELERELRAKRPEEGRIVAWRSKNHKGQPIAITVEDLERQPHYVKEMWRDAEPLYASPPQKD